MRRSTYFAITGIVLASSVSAILGAIVQYNRPSRSFATFRPGISSTGNEKINECKNGDPVPTVAFNISIKTPVDLRKISSTIVKLPIENGFPDGNPNHPINYAYNPSQPKTRLDLNLDLKEKESKSSHSSVLIKVILDPADSASFRTDGFAVTSSDPANKSMFCIRDPKDFQQKYVIFQANYYNPNNVKNVYGSFNLGINLPETGNETYLTPVFIDPAVKNNG